LNVHQARELLREVDELQDTLRDLVAELEKVVQRGDEERVTL
jgi:benzoyl-CoA reductase/2-hydroxyglutaryl-CoA dehydratase subunit BcrC/BadD/HgdB